ncbi:regulatory protein RecX [Myroides profundi]|uniref:Regulatory protein RecX n=1 Tax=Myroides profundi TaxID=480520 RepID=A0AAJ4W5M7_MYRPR|nr:regulatory protein RecX [Myroides profundi]AJH16690.1 regulatory protein [Myroides profundi]SEQ77358.1 regulatory protein [Myroides profundi]
MSLTLEQAKNKLEHFCAYQDRCHTEVISKLFNLKVSSDLHDEILVYLINNKFLNEERFARSFARGKHRISGWGKNRILGELKIRKISANLIKIAMTEIDDTMYFETLNKLAEQRWQSLTDKDINKKKQKLIGFLHRKGYEMEYILDKVNDLQKE